MFAAPVTTALRRAVGAVACVVTLLLPLGAAAQDSVSLARLKIAPDLDSGQIGTIARLVQSHGIDAVIATNTTTAREDVAAMRHAGEAGGLSGSPLKAKSTRVIRELSCLLRGAVPVIGVGGILDAADAREKIDAGASLVQLYTGLIYRGPLLVSQCIDALCAAAAHPS